MDVWRMVLGASSCSVHSRRLWPTRIRRSPSGLRVMSDWTWRRRTSDGSLSATPSNSAALLHARTAGIRSRMNSTNRAAVTEWPEDVPSHSPPSLRRDHQSHENSLRLKSVEMAFHDEKRSGLLELFLGGICNKLNINILRMFDFFDFRVVSLQKKLGSLSGFLSKIQL